MYSTSAAVRKDIAMITTSRIGALGLAAGSRGGRGDAGCDDRQLHFSNRARTPDKR